MHSDASAATARRYVVGGGLPGAAQLTDCSNLRAKSPCASPKVKQTRSALGNLLIMSVEKEEKKSESSSRGRALRGTQQGSSEIMKQPQ